MPRLTSGRPKRAVACGDDEVARKGRLESTTDGVAFDGGDERLHCRASRQAKDSAFFDRGAFAAGQRSEVGTRTERSSCASQDPDAQRVIGVELI
jgi:hypothetical protein